jgi:serine/threonine-protein kinase
MLLRGKWRLERVLGVGGMAVVYAATHRNQARVAIKMLHPEVALDREVTERFLREGYLANTVDHPGTVKVLDDDVSEDGAPFLVMELLEGETLEARWVRKGRRLPVSELLPVANQVLDVLATAHDKGIVHRDLKPENLFLTRTGELKILDFGIARLHELSQDTTQTRAGSVMGTPAFMSPEQARGRWEQVDARTDIWALGATMFTLLTGRYVHEGVTVQEQLILAATQPAPSIASLLDGLSPRVIELVDRALAFDKHARWSDPRAMQQALRGALEAEGLVDRLTLPAPSSPGMEAPTLVASPELLSGAISAPGSALTTRAVTNSSRNPQQGKKGLVALSGVLLLLLGSATAWHLATRGSTEALPLPPTPATPNPGPVEIGPLATAPALPATAPPATTPAPPTSVAGVKPPRVPVTKQPKETGKLPKKPPEEPTGPATSLTGAPKPNPFDKRL